MNDQQLTVEVVRREIASALALHEGKLEAERAKLSAEKAKRSTSRLVLGVWAFQLVVWGLVAGMAIGKAVN